MVPLPSEQAQDCCLGHPRRWQLYILEGPGTEPPPRLLCRPALPPPCAGALCPPALPAYPGRPFGWPPCLSCPPCPRAPRLPPITLRLALPCSWWRAALCLTRARAQPRAPTFQNPLAGSPVLLVARRVVPNPCSCPAARAYQLKYKMHKCKTCSNQTLFC